MFFVSFSKRTIGSFVSAALFLSLLTPPVWADTVSEPAAAPEGEWITVDPFAAQTAEPDTEPAAAEPAPAAETAEAAAPAAEEEEWVDTSENRVFTGSFSVFENMDIMEQIGPKEPDPEPEPEPEPEQASTYVQQFLLDIAQPDPNYAGGAVAITDADRRLLEKIVMGECNSSLNGAMLVAQCLRDGMNYGGYETAAQVRKAFSYVVSPYSPNQNAVEAVRNVFDNGESVVQHRILYFYAPSVTGSRFHESQNFVIEYGGHRYFDAR